MFENNAANSAWSDELELLLELEELDDVEDVDEVELEDVEEELGGGPGGGPLGPF